MLLERTVSDLSGAEYVEGVVENVIYSNETNGYSVCELDTGSELITIVGIMPSVNAGESIKAAGKWETHSSYGKQFKVETYEKQLPATREAMVKYLSSGAIKGVGAVTARRIVDKFGDDSFDVLENHPEWLSDIKGINSSKAQEISDSFKDQSGIRAVMMFAKGHFGPATAMKVYNKWGTASVDMIKNNPYILCENISGIGFVSADRLAESIGYAKDSEFRIESGIKYALLYNAQNNGHIFIPGEKLVSACSEMLGVSDEKTRRALASLHERKEVVSIERSGRECIYLSEYYAAEKYIADKLMLLDRVCERTSSDDLDYMIAQTERAYGMVYAGRQRKAICAAVNSGVMILTGGPGTGKTTVIRAVIDIYEKMGFKVALAAPTGRAAKRMSEATSYEAKTIHRLLDTEYISGERTRFRRNENNLLEENVVIVDEASMVDTMLMAALLKAIRPGGHIVLIGDADQLPSVGAGTVLCDLIKSERFEVIRLNEIFRQARQSRIVTNAHAVNNGELPVLTDKKGDFFFLSRPDPADIVQTVVDLCKKRLPSTYNADPMSAIQVITPSHKGSAGTDALNPALQKALNPPDKSKREKVFGGITFREGDKVMQIKNDYEIEWERFGETGSGIFNGDIGIIKQIDFKNEAVSINFDDRLCSYDFSQLDELEHAYAITIHKSQGSEYPIVVIPVYWCAPRLLTRNLLYTAITRAQRLVVLVGDSSVVQVMVENNRLIKRYTGLCDMLSFEC